MKHWTLCGALILLITSVTNVQADVFSDITANRGRLIEPEYFGMHLHRLVLNPQEKAVRTRWPELVFGGIRLWDSGTNWAKVAPQPGQWEYDRFDTYVNEANANGAAVLYTLGATPRWASARPDERCSYGFGCSAEPVRLAHWEEYVRRIVQRYGSRIQAYELWNEPHFSDFHRDRGRPAFFTGSIATMVEMARLARKALDEFNPEAKLCTPGFVNGPDRLEAFLAAGGKQYVQAVCYHFYAENSRHFARQVFEVRAIMKRQGLEKLPLWNTETGVDTLGENDPPSGIAARSRDAAVARLSQLLILGSAAGLERFYYYAWDNFRSGMVTPQGEAMPGYETLRRLQTWLLGSRLGSCTGTGSVVRCNGEKDNGRFILAWSAQPERQSFSAPAGWYFSRVESLDSGQVSVPDVTDRELTLQFGDVPVRIQLQRLTLR